MSRHRPYSLIFVLGLLLAACGSPPPGSGTPAAQVAVGVENLNLEAGKQTRFTVTVTPQAGFAGTILVTSNIQLATTGITVGPLTPWNISGSTPLTREFTVSAAPEVAPGKYVVTVSFSLDGQDVGQAKLALTVRPEGDAGPLSGSRLALGFEYGLAVASDGSVWAWGSNAKGQLGTPASAGPNPAPQRVQGLPAGVKATAVATSSQTAYALLETGAIYSWGDSQFGQLGREFVEGNEHVPGPVAISGEPVQDFTAVFGGGGYSVMALREGGSVWSWGINNSGQLGAETPSFFTETPTLAAQSLQDVEDIKLGFRHVVATAGGGVWAWGNGQADQHGNGVRVPVQRDPLEVEFGSGSSALPVSIAAGEYHSLAAFDDGSVWSWGRLTYGVLGRVEDGALPLPVEFPESSAHVVQVAAGALHSLALLADGTVWAWGSNLNKQLVSGTIAESSIPRLVPLDGAATYIAAGDRFSYAVLENGTVWAWGSNGSGQHGDTDGTGSSGRPAQVRLAWEE